MDARTVVDVEGWESRPFGGGYDGLQDLASREFTGCVVAGDTYLFMTRGRVVGLFDYVEPSMGDPSLEPADIDRFEGADGTAYEAPHDALALLFAMVASGGEVRGRYYSNDTPLEEVDRTLQDGGFTGYLELSENVLSGDYYLVYHGGRRRTVAFVGQSRRLKTDEEAFDLAADEVGIYEVTAVPLSTVEIPGSSADGDAAVVPDAGPRPSDGDDNDTAAGSGGSEAVTGVGGPGRSSDPPDTAAGGEPSEDDPSTSVADAGTSSERPEAESGTTDAGGGPNRPEIDLDAALDPGGTDQDADDGGDEDATDASPASPLGGAFAGDVEGTGGSGETGGTEETGETEVAGGTGQVGETGQANEADDAGEIEGAGTVHGGDPDETGPPGTADPGESGDVAGPDESDGTGDVGGATGQAESDDPGAPEPDEIGEALATEPGSSVDPEARDESGQDEDAGTDDETPGGTGNGPEADSGTETAAVESSISAVPDDETVGPGEGTPEPPSVEASGTTGEATPEDVEAAAAAADPEIETESGTGSASGSEAEPESGADADHGRGTGATADTGDVDAERVVPSIDPDRTARAEPDDDGAADRQVIDGETVAGLRSELAAREARIEALRERLESVETDRDELATERDRLEERVSELERRLAESGAAPVEDTRELPPAEALSETSVLIRYRSKGEPTLADAHDGGAERGALAENLVLEPHPSFDTEGVSVSGRTFDAFLESTQAYAFLRWLVGEFPYEIRETDSASALKALYDALPTLDRVEFDATVTLEGADRETARFDLVARDRRGNPLLVALLEDDRAPTSAETMREFVRATTAAAESHESLVGAFAVTASYFEPEALQTVEEATAGSLLSRSKRRSFVNTSRKGGYHLCLVEDREESFYLSEPEL